MGQLIDGCWYDQWYDIQKDGCFQCENVQCCYWLGELVFFVEGGCYYFYVLLVCFWVYWILIVCKLKGLELLVDVLVVSWLMCENGWIFDFVYGFIGDCFDGLVFLYQCYICDDLYYSGWVMVLLLWDKQVQKIVNNELVDIVCIFNSVFDVIGVNVLDFYLELLCEEIECFNGCIYFVVNNGVYCVGFVICQDVYEEVFVQLFEELDYLEGLFGECCYLVGEYLIEVDICLFIILVCFDVVYYGYFKCNLWCIEDYLNFFGWLCELY